MSHFDCEHLFFSTLLNIVMLGMCMYSNNIKVFVKSKCLVDEVKEFEGSKSCKFSADICLGTADVFSFNTSSTSVFESLSSKENERSCNDIFRADVVSVFVPMIIVVCLVTVVTITDHFIHYKLIRRINTFVI